MSLPTAGPQGVENGFQPPMQGGSEFDLSQYLNMVRRHWKLALLIVVFFVGNSIVRYLITPRAYRASTTIEIDRTSIPSVIGDQAPWYENYFNTEFYPTQYRLLRSRGLAERVVKNLDLASDPKFNPGGVGSASSGGHDAAADQAALGHMAQRLLGGLSVDPIGKTQLVTISYDSSNPKLAAKIANGFAEAYIEWGVETRSSNVLKTSSFLGSQIENLKKEIAEREGKLQAYSKRSDIVALDGSSNTTLQRLQTLNQDYIKAISSRIAKESAYKELVNAPDESAADSLSGGLVGDQRRELLHLESDYANKLHTYKPDWPPMVDLKAKIEQKKESLQSLINETVSKARDKAKADYQTALRQEQSLKDELDKVKGEAMQLNSAAVEYNNLKVEVSTRRALLNELLKRESETEMVSRLQDTHQSNVRVVDRALVPGGPFRPSLRKNLIMGLGLGLLLGLGAAFLIEFLDRTIKTPDEVEMVLGLPTLTVVPDTSESSRGYGYGGVYYGYGRKRKQEAARHGRGVVARIESGGREQQIELLPHTHPRLAAAEAYRSLRTALMLSSAEQLKLITVTSATSSEGKTSTASNLAVVMAQLGKKTLLVDCDLRKPRLHRVLHLTNRLGLVSYLTGGCELDAIVQASKIPSLWGVTCGPIPPNPSELLASDRMKDFLERMKRQFDFVIIDSPPALLVTDATIVGSRSDGIVLCLQAGKVTRDDARTCLDRLDLADIHTLGVVLNRFRSGQHRYGRKYQYYESYEDSEETRNATAAS